MFNTLILKNNPKHSPAAHVPTEFLVPPNIHSCFYNLIETRTCFLFLNPNMALRLLGQNCNFFVFLQFVSQFPNETWKQRKCQSERFAMKALESC